MSRSWRSISSSGRWPHGAALLPDALRQHRKTIAVVYYAGALVLVTVGSILWATGHGTGDPYLTIGIALAVLPPAVIWVRRWFGRG